MPPVPSAGGPVRASAVRTRSARPRRPEREGGDGERTAPKLPVAAAVARAAAQPGEGDAPASIRWRDPERRGHRFPTLATPLADSLVRATKSARSHTEARS